jgi:hypothetical protein
MAPDPQVRQQVVVSRLSGRYLPGNPKKISDQAKAYYHMLETEEQEHKDDAPEKALPVRGLVAFLLGKRDDGDLFSI